MRSLRWQRREGIFEIWEDLKEQLDERGRVVMVVIWTDINSYGWLAVMNVREVKQVMVVVVVMVEGDGIDPVSLPGKRHVACWAALARMRRSSKNQIQKQHTHTHCAKKTLQTKKVTQISHAPTHPSKFQQQQEVVDFHHHVPHPHPPSFPDPSRWDLK